LITVGICGASGKIGREVVKAVSKAPDLKLVSAFDLTNQGKDAGEVAGIGKIGVVISSSLEEMLEKYQPEVVVDFTSPHSVFDNVMRILEKAHAVVGTTGLTDEQLEEIRKKTLETGYNAAVCPNFAIGAVLMMKFAETASRYFSSVEIIELHHDGKLDAPSGTALATARKILSNLKKEEAEGKDFKELLSGVRGGNLNGIHIHSVRLPGLVAHQEVIFGGEGQTLTIRHDSIDRSSFMPGVILAIREVINRKGLTFGLEALLEL
jgi:4-hydroxy-tetrahydrodipicolinate reductase